LTVNRLVDTVPATIAALDLREAILLVNSGGTATDASGNSLSAAKASQINTSQPFGTNDTIAFAPGLSGDIGLTIGDFVLSQSVAIQGPGAGQLAVIVGTNGITPESAIFEIGPGATASIAGLTIGSGGIINSGTLAVASSTFGPSGSPAISNTGALTV